MEVPYGDLAVVLIGEFLLFTVSFRVFPEDGVPLVYLVERLVTSRCKLKPFVVGRTMTQASRFSSEELLACMKRCAELDDAIKKGNLRDQLAVELLIVELSGIAGTK